MAYGLARRTFVWGGRRYRWREKFDDFDVERQVYLSSGRDAPRV
jgi:hypothetical protein